MIFLGSKKCGFAEDRFAFGRGCRGPCQRQGEPEATMILGVKYSG